MVTLLIGVAVLGTPYVSWYGRKALQQIQKWGEKMNETDAIFQSAATAEEMALYSAPSDRHASKPACVSESHAAIKASR